MFDTSTKWEYQQIYDRTLTSKKGFVVVRRETKMRCYVSSLEKYTMGFCQFSSHSFPETAKKRGSNSIEKRKIVWGKREVLVELRPLSSRFHVRNMLALLGADPPQI